MATVKKQSPNQTAVKKKVVAKTSPSPAKKPSSGYFSQIITEVGPTPYIIVVHGVGGVGKTSWAAYAPKPIFLLDDQELGIFDLMSSKQINFEVPVLPPAANWEQVGEMLDEVQTKGISEGYKTLVIDSATGMEYLCFKHHCEESFGGDWSQRGFFNYTQGPKSAAKSLWPEFLRQLMTIRNQGMNVIIVAHSQIKNFANPEGPDFERWTPYLDKEIWATTFRVMENVFFMNYYIDVQTEGGKTRGKGMGGQRFLYTTWAPAYDAKNRWGLQEHIDMGDSGKDAYHNFSQFVSEEQQKITK